MPIATLMGLASLNDGFDPTRFGIMAFGVATALGLVGLLFLPPRQKN